MTGGGPGRSDTPFQFEIVYLWNTNEDFRNAVKETREAGIYPYFHALESRQDVEVTMEGKRRIMLGSNNYLGLTIHPEVVEAGIKALEAYGSGCSGSRFLNGTLDIHIELEKKLATEVEKAIRKKAIHCLPLRMEAKIAARRPEPAAAQAARAIFSTRRERSRRTSRVCRTSVWV